MFCISVGDGEMDNTSVNQVKSLLGVLGYGISRKPINRITNILGKYWAAMPITYIGMLFLFINGKK